MSRSGPQHAGRVSKALGGRDPRIGRNPQGLSDHDTLFNATLQVDSSGRVGVKPARRITPLADTATLDDARKKINEIIAALQEAGLMET